MLGVCVCFICSEHMVFELILWIFQSLFVWVMQNQPCWTAYRGFIFVSIHTPQQLCPLAILSLKITCFQKNVCAKTSVGEFAISLFFIKVHVGISRRSIYKTGPCQMAMKQEFWLMGQSTMWPEFNTSTSFHKSLANGYKKINTCTD